MSVKPWGENRTATQRKAETMATDASTKTIRLTGTIRVERTRYERDFGQNVRFDETVEVQVEVTIDKFDILWEMGRRAAWSKARKARSMSGAIKAKILSEQVLDSRRV
jgi:hypothetical protein